VTETGSAPLYQRIYAFVRQVPAGKVISYGQIARIVGGCSARMVGYAMAALKSTRDIEEVPWQRVINSQGKISSFGDGFGNAIQEQLLRGEGIHFDDQERVNDPQQWWIEKPF
jgi:methylated-DNA-protein-cysteine methyltransferase related protein